MWAFKLDHIRHVVENEDAIFYTQLGYMPAYWNFMVQFGLGILFSAVAIYWLATGLKEKKEAKSEFTWLICVATLMFLGNLFAMIALIFDSSNLDLHSVNAYLFALYLIIIFCISFLSLVYCTGRRKVSLKNHQFKQLKAEISSSELRITAVS